MEILSCLLINKEGEEEANLVTSELNKFKEVEEKEEEETPKLANRERSSELSQPLFGEFINLIDWLQQILAQMTCA